MGWDEIAIELKEQFYELVGNESEKLYERIKPVIGDIEKIGRRLDAYFKPAERSDDLDEVRIAAIDGSSTSTISIRLGCAYSLFSIVVVRDAYKFRSDIDVSYFAFKVSSEYPEDKLLKRLTTWNMLMREREIALKEVEDSDLVIIDGSFFGYLHSIFKLVRMRMLPREIRDLATKITDYTIRLVESGRVIGVVKRGRTSAIIPWAYMEGIISKPHRMIDRLILSMVQPVGSTFSYTHLFGYSFGYKVFNRAFREILIGKRPPIDKLKGDLLELISISIENTGAIITSRQLLDMAERIVVRHYPTGPVEMDVPLRREGILWDFLCDNRMFSDATNIPWINDLADLESRIPSDFSRDFADEVEATLVRRFDLNPEFLRAFFTNINPQKDLPE